MDSAPLALLARLARLGAGLAVLLCLAVLLGWTFDQPLLTTFGAGAASSALATAVALIFAAVSIYGRASVTGPAIPIPRWSPVAAGLALAVGVYAFTTYLPEAAIAFIPETGRGGHVFGPDLGRVAPATAACIVLLGLGLLVPERFGRLAAGCATFGLIISALAIEGYVYGVESLYRVIPLTAMSLPTALSLAILFFSALLARPGLGWIAYLASPDSGGRTARRLFPAVILIPFLLSWLVVRSNQLGAFDPPFGFAIVSSATTILLGAIVCMISTSLSAAERDLTRSNENLRESRELGVQIIETALDAFVQMDETGAVTEWSRQAEAMLGWPRAEAVGRLLESLILPPEARNAHRAGLASFLATGENRILGRRIEVEALRRDDTRIKVELTVTAQQRRTGYQFNGFIRDLTQKAAIEAQLRQSQKMEAIGNLTGGMAHDFNNLLGVIIGNLDLLQERPEEDATARELSGSALDAALRGADLTRRLLAFARLQPLAPEVVQVNQLVASLVKLLSRLLGEDVEVSLRLAPEVWPILVDPAQLEASLANLATNARDAMLRGGRLVISTANRQLDADYAAQNVGVTSGDYAMIEVSDTGGGMSRDVVARIFDPFFTTKEQGKGTGLGLSMVFGFIKQSGGHVSVYSEVGVGTTFRLFLPRAEAVAAAQNPAAEPLARQGTEVVLVVEDNDALRRVVARQLDSLGYRVIERNDAAGGMQALESEAIDLLFTDIVMPGSLNGIDLARGALERWPKLKVVLTSGFPDTNIGQYTGSSTGMRLLQKPYRKEELAQVIRNALDS